MLMRVSRYSYYGPMYSLFSLVGRRRKLGPVTTDTFKYISWAYKIYIQKVI